MGSATHLPESRRTRTVLRAISRIGCSKSDRLLAWSSNLRAEEANFVLRAAKVAGETMSLSYSSI